MTALIFIIVLAVLIFVHELGHFLVARWSGIRVDAFKLGFGPKIFAWKRGETEYGVNLIPFGGYVKIHGENPDEESMNGPDAARSFVNKPRWKQALVLVAGVGFNFIFAWILYAGGFMSGVTATSDGFEKYADDFTDNRVMITYVSPGSPAEKAGVREGDVLVVEVGPDPIKAFQDRVDANGAKVLSILIRTNDESRTVDVIPAKGLVADKYAIGVALQEVGDLKLSFISAIWEGLRYTLVMIRETTIGLCGFVLNIFRGAADFSDITGPIGIAGIVGGAARLGFTYLLMIIALISINLGVINLIPFPALDGGRILFVAIEGIIRRRIPIGFTNMVNTIGFCLLMILMVVVTYKDVAKLFR